LNTSEIPPAVVDDRDDRKTAALTFAEAEPQNNSNVADTFAFSREILRSPDVVQAARGADTPFGIFSRR
jgi:hypothetical protein